MPFKPRLSAVLRIFLLRRKAVVVLRKVAEGFRFDCGLYGFFAVFTVSSRSVRFLRGLYGFCGFLRLSVVCREARL